MLSMKNRKVKDMKNFISVKNFYGYLRQYRVTTNQIRIHKNLINI